MSISANGIPMSLISDSYIYTHTAVVLFLTVSFMLSYRLTTPQPHSGNIRVIIKPIPGLKWSSSRCYTAALMYRTCVCCDAIHPSGWQGRQTAAASHCLFLPTAALQVKLLKMGNPCVNHFFIICYSSNKLSLPPAAGWMKTSQNHHGTSSVIPPYWGFVPR